jgi:hypothetical protein
MRHCLELTLRCPVSLAAFCVGSTLFLPSSSPLIITLRAHFPAFPANNRPAHGLILADGYSRQIPGNTHAEANALANFRAVYAGLLASSPDLPSVEDVLRQADCYATMEPCSIRTSGGPSCALELVRSRVRTVFLVSPPSALLQLADLSGRRRTDRFRAM